MPVVKANPKPSVQEAPKPVHAAPTPLPVRAEGNSMVLAQLAGQNSAIAEMLRSLSGRRVVDADVIRDERGLIQKIRMTVEMEA